LFKKIYAYLVGLIFFFPIFFLITSAIKPTKDIFAIPPKILFFSIDLENFKNVFSQINFFPSIVDSFIIAFGSAGWTLIIAIYSSYYLSRNSFKFKNLFIISIISTRMMPLVSISIPLYFVFSKINLLDTYLGLILIHSCINLPLAVLLMKSFYDDIPKEIDENAFIDGASKFLILHKLIIPLSLGGLSVTFILSFVFSWTEFICAVMLSQMEIKTLPVYASLYKTLPSWDAMSVIISISLLPLFILLLSVQKYIVRGLTLGSIKE